MQLPDSATLFVGVLLSILCFLAGFASLAIFQASTKQDTRSRFVRMSNKMRSEPTLDPRSIKQSTARVRQLKSTTAAAAPPSPDSIELTPAFAKLVQMYPSEDDESSLRR